MSLADDTAPPIDVLVVDDQQLVRSGFAMILGSEPGIRVVGEAADGEAALTQVRALRPHVVLMDVQMPRMDGIEATRRIVQTSSSRVIVLTTFDLDAYVLDALAAGASGFLLKDAPIESLVHAVRVVAAGEAVLAPSTTRRLLDRLAWNPPQPSPGTDPLEGLTDREREVCRRMGRGLTNAEIAADLVLAETTVKTHVGNVLAKLGLRDRVQVVVWCYENGLVQPGG